MADLPQKIRQSSYSAGHASETIISKARRDHFEPHDQRRVAAPSRPPSGSTVLYTARRKGVLDITAHHELKAYFIVLQRFLAFPDRADCASPLVATGRSINGGPISTLQDNGGFCGSGRRGYGSPL